MKTPKSVAVATVEAFEDVRSAFLPRPEGEVKMIKPAAENQFAGAFHARLH